MAYLEIPSTNISFSTFDTFSTEYSSDSNISLSTVLAALKPSNPTTDQSIDSYLRGDKILYGSLTVETGGYVAVTGTNISETVDEAIGATLTFENLNLTDSSLTLTATPVYPYTFAGYYNGATLLQTDATLTLSGTNHSSVTAFTAKFSTTHTSP
jgi:hypothetical protein